MKLRTGRALGRTLEQRRALTVQAIPLREVLSDFQEQTGLCIVLDRRVDPSTRVTLNVALTSTEQILRQITALLPEAGLSVNRSFVYIGPKKTAHRLRTLCEQQRAAVLKARGGLSSEAYVSLSSAQPLAWGDLQSPRNVLMVLAEGAGVSVVNLSAIPRDLWHSGRLAKMPFAESATLLLAQFDLMYTLDPNTGRCEIVPMPEVVVTERRHVVPRRLREAARRQLAQAFPGVELEWTKSAVVAQATYEQHQQIELVLAGKPLPSRVVPADSLKTRLFTLSLPENITWKSLIDQLQSSGVSIRVEGELEDRLNEKVIAELKRLPGEEFFPLLFAELPVQVTVFDGEVVLRVTDGE